MHKATSKIPDLLIDHELLNLIKYKLGAISRFVIRRIALGNNFLASLSASTVSS